MLIEKKLVCTNNGCNYEVKIMTDTASVSGIKKLMPKKCLQCGNKTFKEEK